MAPFRNGSFLDHSFHVLASPRARLSAPTIDQALQEWFAAFAEPYQLVPPAMRFRSEVRPELLRLRRRMQVHILQVSPITAGVTAWLAGCPFREKRSPILTMIPVNGARMISIGVQGL